MAQAPPRSWGSAERMERLQLRPQSDATLRVDCPLGMVNRSEAVIDAKDLIVTESREHEPGIWWTTFSNPSDQTVIREVEIKLRCVTP